MPAGAKPGERRGGRAKGVIERRFDIDTILQRCKCDPFEILARVSTNNVPCGVCRGTGKTNFQPVGEDKAPGVRVCQSCWGSKLERVDPKLLAWAAAEIAQYVAPKRKAIEHSGHIGGDLTDRLNEGRKRIAAFKEKHGQ